MYLMYGINFVHSCVIQIVSDEVLNLKSKHKDRFMRFFGNDIIYICICTSVWKLSN